MTGPGHRRGKQARRRTRVLLAVGLVGFTVATVAFFVAGLILPGLLATLAGLATVAVAGWNARPVNWPPENRDPESR